MFLEVYYFIEFVSYATLMLGAATAAIAIPIIVVFGPIFYLFRHNIEESNKAFTGLFINRNLRIKIEKD